MHERASDDFWRFWCRQMAGLKSLTQSDMTRHLKPLGAVAYESLLLKGPYLATKIKRRRNADFYDVFFSSHPCSSIAQSVERRTVNP